MRIPLPLGGLHNGTARADQPLGTSLDLMNVFPFDCRTGREALAWRPGSSKYCSVVTGGAKVKAIVALPDANQNVTYASLGDSVTTEWAKRLPAAVAVDTDRQGNVYAIVDRVTVVKFNPAGTKLWTLVLPTTDTAHVARALRVDTDGRVFVGISAGGSQANARLWCYTQGDDNKTSLLWELGPNTVDFDGVAKPLGAYVEQIKIKGNKLYTLQNRTDRGASEVVVYEGFIAPNPTETARFSTCSPANDMDPGVDGNVLVAGPVNATRGLDPLAPDASPKAIDWTPELLPQWGQRAWAWVRADHPGDSIEDNFIATDVTGAPNSDGASISTWLDRTENGRNLYGGTLMGLTSRTNPTLRLRGSSGKPSVYFNGTTSKMISNGNANTTDQFQQASFVPGYTGSMYVLAGVVKMNTGVTDRRWCFGIQTAAGSQKFFLNVDSGSGFPAAADTGSAAWYESQTTTGASGVGTKPNNYPFTSLHPWNRVSTTGSRNLPNGWIVFVIAFTNGQAGFESWARINGNPVDVWTSTADTWTDGFQLGEVTTVSTGTTKDPSGSYDFFQGEVMELLCLRDYRDSSGTLSLIEVNGTGGQVYPNANFAGIPNTENTEVQKLEGYLAQKWGAGHVLPAGTAGRLTFSAVANNNDTVTIGATTYTFKTTLSVGPAVANEVLRGASAATSAINLIRAINLSGTAATDYGTGTALNASAWAYPQRFNEDADATPAIIIRSLEQSSTAFATTESTAGVRMAWTSTTSQTSLAPDAAGENTGFYPHPFTQKRVINASQQIISTGGPPRQSSTSADYVAPSKAGLLNSVYSLLVKHADSGRPRWVATSLYATPTTAVGGVGWGCLAASDGASVFSCGPRQAALGGGSADNTDVRKIIDSGDSFSLTNGATSTTAWVDSLSAALTYEYPRMDVDSFDNLYLPVYQASVGTSLIVYALLGNASGAPDNANELATVQNITSDPRGYAVAVHPIAPEYPTSFTDDRAQFVYLGTDTADSATVNTLYKLGLISVTNATGSPSTDTYLVVNGATISTFTTSAVTSLGSLLDSSAQIVSTAVAYRKAFFVDGRKPYYYDATTGAASEWTATGGGEIMPRAKLIAVSRGRLWLARGDNPSQWACSAVGDPFDWDFFPPVFTFSSAVSGVTALAGQPSDVINSLHAIEDDYMLFGGARSIRAMAGDPANPTSQIQLVCSDLGTMVGPVWARDQQGVSYFVGSDANVYALASGSWARKCLTKPEDANDPTSDIHEILRTIEYTTYYPRLTFELRWNLLILSIEPYGAGGVAQTTHYAWHKSRRGWFPIQKAAAGTQWTCVARLGNQIVFGREDGYIEKWDTTANTDDGVRVEHRATIWPIVPENEEFEGKTSAMQAVLAAESDGTNVQLFASSIPTLPTVPNVTTDLRPGHNNIAARMSGSYVGIRFQDVSAGTLGTHCAIESVHLDVKQGGRKRHAAVR